MIPHQRPKYIEFKVFSPLLVAFLFFGPLGFTTGCGPRVHSYPSLINQGILPLSTSNAYVGANLFLSHELENSSFLYSFFKGRGAPTAIELTEMGVSGTRMIMYYPKDFEVYAADLQSSPDRREWIVRGPYQIERADYRQLAGIQTSLVGEPLFILFGKEHRFRFHGTGESPKVKVPPVKEPPPATPKPKAKAKPAPIIKAHRTTAPLIPTVSAPATGTLSSDQQALLAAKQPAKRAPNGDLIHVVGTAPENLEAIVRWYTLSADALNEIKAKNALSSDEVPPGKEIVIPIALVKETRAMPKYK